MASAKVRRYDDVIQLLASVLLGVGLQFFKEVVDGLSSLTYSSAVSYFTTFSLFFVFFRNVHGLIAYDVWAEAHDYEPPFESTTGHIVAFFIFAFLAAILFPSSAVYVLKNHTGRDGWLVSSPYSAWWLFGFLVAPVIVYVVWDVWWLIKLWKNSSGHDHPAHLELLKFTKRWCVIDIVCLVVLSTVISRGASLNNLWACVAAASMAVVAVLLDYGSHLKYYFPLPTPTATGPRRELAPAYDDYQRIWDYVLPDGRRFCHWGGVRQSKVLARLLKITNADRVLEVCCGAGGTVSFMAEGAIVCGVDISHEAVLTATRAAYGDRKAFLTADANRLPFRDGAFTKILSQDGDAWLRPAKGLLMDEIWRVTAPGGLFIYQTYARFCGTPERIVRKTKRLLRACGFTETSVPHVEELTKMFETAGFTVTAKRDLQRVYALDNLRMLRCLRRNERMIYRSFSPEKVNRLATLLRWEKMLFTKRWWTGVRIIAVKGSQENGVTARLLRWCVWVISASAARPRSESFG